MCVLCVYVFGLRPLFYSFRGDRTWDLSCECTFTNLILQIGWKDKKLFRYNYSAVVKSRFKNISLFTNYAGIKVWLFRLAVNFFVQYSNLLQKVQLLNAGGSGKSKTSFLLLLVLYCGNTAEIIKIRVMELLFRFCFMLVISLLMKYFHFINPSNFTICFIMLFHLA